MSKRQSASYLDYAEFAEENLAPGALVGGAIHTVELAGIGVVSYFIYKLLFDTEALARQLGGAARYYANSAYEQFMIYARQLGSGTAEVINSPNNPLTAGVRNLLETANGAPIEVQDHVGGMLETAEKINPRLMADVKENLAGEDFNMYQRLVGGDPLDPLGDSYGIIDNTVPNDPNKLAEQKVAEVKDPAVEFEENAEAYTKAMGQADEMVADGVTEDVATGIGEIAELGITDVVEAAGEFFLDALFSGVAFM